MPVPSTLGNMSWWEPTQVLSIYCCGLGWLYVVLVPNWELTHQHLAPELLAFITCICKCCSMSHRKVSFDMIAFTICIQKGIWHYVGFWYCGKGIHHRMVLWLLGYAVGVELSNMHGPMMNYFLLLLKKWAIRIQSRCTVLSQHNCKLCGDATLDEATVFLLKNLVSVMVSHKNFK